MVDHKIVISFVSVWYCVDDIPFARGGVYVSQEQEVQAAFSVIPF